jgi:adenylate cyclase
MCAPLLGRNRLLGVLYVDNMERVSAFTQEELNVFALIAAQTGAAIDNAMAHQKIARQAQQRLALERFLSPEVAEMAMANPDVRLGGVNQKVTVMFADIRGFTTLSEALDPTHVVEILNEYFTRVTDVIFDHGGMIDKYIGDAVMAVFGAPISKGNDAARAVETAVEIQQLMTEMNRDAKARSWPELKIGIGVNTGLVTAGNIGSPRRLDYTVVGDTVNIASRIMDSAEGGKILISDSTAAELGQDFSLRKLPLKKMRGRSEPVRIFSVEWLKDGARNRRSRRSAHGSG